MIAIISDLHYSLFIPIAYFEIARRAYVEAVLGAFEKHSEKRLLASPCLFFHPSACQFVRVEYLGSHRTDFREILHEGFSVIPPPPSMPPHVLMNFRGFPPGCGDSVADY